MWLYNKENREPSMTRDMGGGVMVPVCRYCAAHLVAINSPAAVTIRGILSILIGLFGLLVLFFNWLDDLLVLILAVLVATVGRRHATVLTCPVCGLDDHEL